jgi:hypothetical protein
MEDSVMITKFAKFLIKCADCIVLYGCMILALSAAPEIGRGLRGSNTFENIALVQGVER